MPEFSLVEQRRIHSDVFEGTRYKQGKYLQKCDAVRAVLCIRRSSQILAFAEIQHRLPDALYWHLLEHVVVHSHNHAAFQDLYVYLLRAPRAGAYKHFMSHPLAQSGYKSLPGTLYLFRGHGAKNKHGLYHTLNLTVAMAYAENHGALGRLHSFLARKKDCLYLGGKIENHEQVLYIPGLGFIQDVMNGTDENAKEKLQEWWHNNPPEGFTA